MADASQSVWFRLFRKPKPVRNRHSWENDERSKAFVFTPNSLLHRGDDAEDVQGNSLKANMLLEAYQGMCRTVGFAPTVVLANGSKHAVLALTKLINCQPVIGERAARLANSRLLEDDSMFVEAFLTAFSKLENYSPAQIRQVRVRVELALNGESGARTNAQFMAAFFKGLDASLVESAQGVLMAMSVEGFVLEEAFGEFCIRINEVGVTEESLLDRYEQLCATTEL